MPPEPTRLHGITSQKNVILICITARISNPRTTPELNDTANAGVTRTDLAVKVDILLEELIHIRYIFIGERQNAGRGLPG